MHDVVLGDAVRAQHDLAAAGEHEGDRPGLGEVAAGLGERACGRRRPCGCGCRSGCRRARRPHRGRSPRTGRLVGDALVELAGAPLARTLDGVLGDRDVLGLLHRRGQRRDSSRGRRCWLPWPRTRSAGSPCRTPCPAWRPGAACGAWCWPTCCDRPWMLRGTARDGRVLRPRAYRRVRPGRPSVATRRAVPAHRRPTVEGLSRSPAADPSGRPCSPWTPRPRRATAPSRCRGRRTRPGWSATPTSCAPTSTPAGARTPAGPRPRAAEQHRARRAGAGDGAAVPGRGGPRGGRGRRRQRPDHRRRQPVAGRGRGRHDRAGLAGHGADVRDPRHDRGGRGPERRGVRPAALRRARRRRGLRGRDGPGAPPLPRRPGLRVPHQRAQAHHRRPAAADAAAGDLPGPARRPGRADLRGAGALPRRSGARPGRRGRAARLGARGARPQGHGGGRPDVAAVRRQLLRGGRGATGGRRRGGHAGARGGLRRTHAVLVPARRGPGAAAGGPGAAGRRVHERRPLGRGGAQRAAPAGAVQPGRRHRDRRAGRQRADPTHGPRTPRHRPAARGHPAR